MLNGIINVYKEEGFTSNDVVAKLRGILHQRKIGHAGTLDPAAVGVLPVLLGSGCRISEYMMDHDKTYRTVLRLGVTTDTQDMTGNVLESRDVSGISEEEITRAILSFQGEYDQIPPMYSAKQINGRRLYDLAREGITVERKPVRVKIGALRIESVSLPEVTFTVDCSKGTYIRTLCADIGDKLGCGGTMAHLTRIRVGGFLIEDALTIGKIEELAGKGDIEDRIIPVEEMFLDHLRVRTQPSCDRKLLNGNRLEPEEMGLPARGAGDLLRVCTSGGEFIAVYRRDEQTGSYRPYRMLTDL